MSSDLFSNGLSNRGEILSLVIRLTFFTVATYFTVKWMVSAIDPTKGQKQKAKEKAKKIMKRLGIKESLKLNEYEVMIASQLIEPMCMDVSWDDIAGLDDVIQELRETVIFPIQQRELCSTSKLTQPPKGVLLHGPPGCGKTLIAKATAKEAACHFINLDVSSLTDKWYGESQKLAASVFTLAVKLQPCIIFLDEIDSLLRSRDSHDHEATAMMKAQFMSLWDGLITDSSCTVIVMGATNRPQDLDRAILRRMPATFHIGLPNFRQRQQIIKLILETEPKDNLDLNKIAKLTEGFSGSDLRELCRASSVYRVRDFMKQQDKDELRPITMADLTQSLAKIKESKAFCQRPQYMSPVELD